MYGSPSAPDSHGVVRWKCPPGHLLKFALERSRVRAHQWQRRS